MNPSELLQIPPDADLAYGWIRALIPLGESAFAKAFAAFSGALAFFGAILLAWHVVAGLVSSAYSGRVIGDKYHKFYAPIRIVVGFAMLMPIGDGFSAVHYLLRNVVGVAAVQLGNAPIKSYLSELSSGTPMAIPSSMGAEVVKNILDKELCIRIHNGLQEYRWFNWSGRHTPEFGEVASRENASWLPWSDPDPQLHYKWDYGPCGSYSFLIGGGDESVSRRAFYAARKNETEKIQRRISEKLDSVRLEEYFGRYGLTHPDSMLLDQLIDLGYMVPTLRDISGTVADWNRAVGHAAGSVYAEENGNRIETLKKQIEIYGFMAAGGFERHLSQISKLTLELANQAPTVAGPNLDQDVMKEIANARSMLQKVSIRDSSGGSAAERSLSITGEYTSLNDLLDEVSAYFVVPEAVRNPDGFVADPVGAMIQRGHYFMAASAAAAVSLAFAYGFAASLGNDAVGLLSFTATEVLGGAISYAVSWSTWAVSLLFVVGLLHAYVLPLIPFLMVFVMGISWLVMFLEATIACVLWAFAFIRMDGDDFIDRHQAPGIGLLFNLLLRPAVGMLVFIGSLILMPTVLRGLIFIWDGVWEQQQHADGALETASRTLTWPFTFIAEYALFLFMQWHLTLRIFGLVPTIADRVGSWMGVSNGHGYNDSGETHSAVSGAVGIGMRTYYR